MKKGSEYEVGQLLTQGPYMEPILMVWSDVMIKDDVFLVVGQSVEFLTIYVVKESVRMAPRLARFIPKELLEEIARMEETKVKKVRTKKARTMKEKYVEDARPKAMPTPQLDEPRPRKRKPQSTRRQIAAEPPAEPPRIDRRRRQRRKSDE